jgi:nucleoside-diphosphate-sugar epimerase
VGIAVVKYLLKQGVNVLCVVRTEYSDDELLKIFGQVVLTIKVEMSEIEQLPERLESCDFKVEIDSVFYHFAWGGNTKLTDGNFEQQFQNAIYTSNALRMSKKIGCSKFINCGTIQETIAEISIKEKSDFDNSQRNYTIAKIASRDMCLMLGYLEKIDYVHTRLSAPIDPLTRNGGYIKNVLSAIMNGNDYSPPSNKQLFDLVHVNDVAKAYYLLGMSGTNKADYYIGPSQPATLMDLFQIAEQYQKGKKLSVKTARSEKGCFDNSHLIQDVGMKIDENIFSILATFKK